VTDPSAQKSTNETPPGAVGVVGVGRLGASLVLSLHSRRLGPAFVASRDGMRADALARGLGGVSAVAARELCLRSECVMLAVPDDELSPLDRGLPWRDGQTAIYFSGSHGLGALSTAARAGVRVACLHPLRAFPARADAGAFRRVTCGVEATDEATHERARELARSLGAEVFSLEGVNRALYHAAAVTVSNHAVALVAAAERIWEQAGLPLEQARPALLPLLLGSVEPLRDASVAEALTGPVARGDADIVTRHIRALSPAPDLQAAYRALALVLSGLELGHDADVQERLAAALELPGAATK
jgi:predicted short-subunit dehydrogenase-like oxidoreductase (DUF2520 family)